MTTTVDGYGFDLGKLSVAQQNDRARCDKTIEQQARHRAGVAGLLGSCGDGKAARIAPHARALPVNVRCPLATTQAGGSLGAHHSEAEAAFRGQVEGPGPPCEYQGGQQGGL